MGDFHRAWAQLFRRFQLVPLAVALISCFASTLFVTAKISSGPAGSEPSELLGDTLHEDDNFEQQEMDDTKLLKVQMLQTSLTIRERKSTNSRNSAIQADGVVIVDGVAEEEEEMTTDKQLHDSNKDAVVESVAEKHAQRNMSLIQESSSGQHRLFTKELDSECIYSLMPFSSGMKMEAFRTLDILPGSVPCSATEMYAGADVLPRNHPVSLAQMPRRFEESNVSTDRVIAFAILLAYALAYFWSVFYMAYYIVYPYKKFDKQTTYMNGQKVITDIDVEEEAWRLGIFSWVGCSWGTVWISWWGSSNDAAFTRVKAEELPQLGNREYQAWYTFQKFKQLWNQEKEQYGPRRSLLRTIFKLWGPWPLIKLLLVGWMLMTVSNLYGMYLISTSLTYYSNLQKQIATNPEQPIKIAIPIIVAILAFNVTPVFTAVLDSINFNTQRRLDQSFRGALIMAVFEKGQRLPSNYLQPQLKKDRMHGKEEELPPIADMTMLIDADINANIAGCYAAVTDCINTVISLVAFTALLFTRLKWATCVAFGITIPMLMLAAYLGNLMRYFYLQIQRVADNRIRCCRELLFGIRVVKSYAWEEAMEERIRAFRKRELKSLHKYWIFMGLMGTQAMVFPRLIVICSLWVYQVAYGTHDVANIYVCIHLLNCLKGACGGLNGIIQRVVNILPSLKRLDDYMMLDEAPVHLPENKPDWVSVWPKEENSVLLRRSDLLAQRELRVKGTYRWFLRADHNPVALYDIDLTVPHGQLVAVCGEVGSGKSNLLKVILGELYPELDKDTFVSRPEVIAYSSQVPHIAEGTLKENVLFAQDMDKERYQAALTAAALDPDLKTLPGGDEVPIGSRGLTLSGGQKARISLARAIYHKSADLVLIDDPFSAVDAPTGKIIMEVALTGPVMKGRTKIVVMQPDAERISKCDKVIVMEGCRIVADGTPAEVMQTEVYKKLLSSREVQSFNEEGEQTVAAPATKEKKEENNQGLNIKLRDDEFEGRPTWEMIVQYIRTGRFRNLLGAVLTYISVMYFYLLCDLCLANWANEIAITAGGHHVGSYYIWSYWFWFVMGTCLYSFTFLCGMYFSLRISKNVLSMMLSKIMRAPVDRFFDRHPVGRIMNRLVADVNMVDFSLYQRSTGALAVLIQSIMPLCYVHFIIPIWISVFTIPLYAVCWIMCKRYWNTTVPLRYCAVNAESDCNSHIADVVNNNTVIRAYRDVDRITKEMCESVDDMIKASLGGEVVLKRWVEIRINLLWSFYTTSVFLVALLNPKGIGSGTLGMGLSALFALVGSVHANLNEATGAQFEFIALARIHEYLNIPQEKPMRHETDGRYRSYTMMLFRKDLGKLSCSGVGDQLKIQRGDKTVLACSSDCRFFVAKDKSSTVADLKPDNPILMKVEAWHSIAAVNGASRETDAMAAELCYGSSEDIMVEVVSGWLINGARVQIEQIKAGYADIPRDVLKGVTLTIEPRAKVGICGKTGCGKSSLLLVLLRILEPRAGKVLLSGVDTSHLGLATLRGALGLVPQDPVLFNSTLRYNLDPFRQYCDDRIWKVIKLAHLTDFVNSFFLGLDLQISEEGGNLSFGQRQLICIARMLLRQPALLLLDEATSAIDPRTQEKVQSTILTAFPNSTIIAIAHRLETVLDFDQVAVLDKGCVAEEGPVKELAQRKDGRFRAMLEARKAW